MRLLFISAALPAEAYIYPLRIGILEVKQMKTNRTKMASEMLAQLKADQKRILARLRA
jgi:hypothetical protein